MAGLRLVTPDGLIQADQAENQRIRVEQDAANENSRLNTSLVAYVDGEYAKFVRHRDSAAGWSDRLTNATLMFAGKYDPSKLGEIRKFGGSDIYARLVATKCRGATSLLRDIYLNADKPWGLKATPDPTLPDDVTADIAQLVQVEIAGAQKAGQQLKPDDVKDRISQLVGSAKRAALKRARLETERAFLKLDDMLVEGGFYEAMGMALIDIPLFPFCCVKGPTVRIVPQVKWVQGRAEVKNVAKMFWNRVSPFDVWWTPGVSNIADAAVVERSRVTRSDLNQLVGLPGYDSEAIRSVLREYGQSGYVEAQLSTTETTRANMEKREDPRMNQSGLIDMLEYHGYVQGSMLLDQGMSAEQVPDSELDYFVDVYKIGRYVLKVQLSPSLRKRPPYYVTSFEKVPGTVVGNALPDILSDIQDATNAALRSLVNNMSIASGPQVVVNDDRIAENEDGDELYPWKRWHVQTDPMGVSNNQPPVTFANVESHAQELLSVYEKLTQIGDELSAIPRYVTGSERTGGAGRTASGLAMLMGNAAKILQTVASNIDGDIVEQVVSELYDMVMLTDQTGILRGDESIDVLGVNVAMQRETQRQRSLEFLQITANPIDSQIMGPRGRATVLRSVADGIGLEGEDIVPPDEEIKAMVAQASGGPPGGAPAGPGGPPGQQPQAPSAPQGPSTNVVGNTAMPGPGSGPSAGGATP